MPNKLLGIDALTIVSSKQLGFPLSLAISGVSCQQTLTVFWQMLAQLRQELANADIGHGKLVLTDFSENISAESGLFAFQTEAELVQLDVTVPIELVFDFQSPLTERLAATAMTLDLLLALAQRYSTTNCGVMLVKQSGVS
jgi:non-ribosomal peptide synthetase component F